MVSSPLRTCTPITACVPPLPPIDTTNITQTGSGSQSLQRVPTEPVSTPPPPQQPTAEELAVFGIKVRDFAFEPSVLPRVPTVQRPYIFFQNLKRPLEETPEDLEARKRNEVRRLEFNTPRRRDEDPEEREAKRLAFSSPRTNGSLENSSSRLGGSTSAQPFEWPVFRRPGPFSRTNLNTSAEAGPSSSPSSGQTTRTPLRRQPSQRWTSSGPSTTPLANRLFANLHLSQRLSSTPPPSQPIVISHRHSRRPSSNRNHNLSLSRNLNPNSDVDDEEYVKTPLVTPDGSLIFDNDDHLHLNSHDSTDADALISDVDNTEGRDSNDARTTVGTTKDDLIFNSSTLPESQVAELLAPVETGPEEDVSTSQMGWFESQDLLSSQPAWQQRSQSHYPSQLLSSNELEQERDEDGDVHMPESQPEEKEGGDGEEESVSMPTLTPKASLTRMPSSTTSPLGSIGIKSPAQAARTAAVSPARTHHRRSESDAAQRLRSHSLGDAMRPRRGPCRTPPPDMPLPAVPAIPAEWHPTLKRCIRRDILEFDFADLPLSVELGFPETTKQLIKQATSIEYNYQLRL